MAFNFRSDKMLFWRTEYWLEYLLNSRLGTAYTDRSFYLENKFIPLVQNGQEFYSPGFDDNKNILAEVKALAAEHNIKRIQVDSQIKSYLNISGHTCIINSFETNLSKGHKSAIKKAQKYLDFEILSQTDQFMLDYFAIAGKKTRPKRTFEILQDWIQKGYGTLLKAIFEGQTAGYIYILHYRGCAYYFMSGTFPEYKQYNVGHYLQSVAFDVLRQKGIKTYELGEQVYNSLTCQPTEKEQNISLFKRNFGGDIVVKPISEYFFDAEYMRQIYSKRIDKYIESEYKYK
jgi:hypothetical protein